MPRRQNTSTKSYLFCQSFLVACALPGNVLGTPGTEMQEAEFPASTELKDYHNYPRQGEYFFFHTMYVPIFFNTPRGTPSPDKPPGTFGICELFTIEIIIENKTNLASRLNWRLDFQSELM